MSVKRSCTLTLAVFYFALVAFVPAQRVAEKKCRQFIAQNSRTTYGGALMLNPVVLAVTTTNCRYSVDLIVGGEEALVGEFPHQALLGYPHDSKPDEIDFRCGGSLISDRFVLTAAHCGRPTSVRLGEHDLLLDEDQEDYEVDAYFKHPQHTISRSYHDIALVKLAEKVMFSSLIRPACLWTSVPLNVTTVTATGFGLTDFAGNSSTTLMKVRLDLMSASVCEEKFAEHRQFREGIHGEQLCVGSLNGSRDTCLGDSGGPLQIVTNVRTCAYHIVGVTSLGISCGTGRAESIYTQVASYLDWIEEIVWPEEYRQMRAARSNPEGIHFPED